MLLQYDWLAGNVRMQIRRIEVATPRPNDGAKFWIDADLAKNIHVVKPRKNASEIDVASDIDFPLGTIIESQKQAITFQRFGKHNVVQHALTSVVQ